MAMDTEHHDYLRQIGLCGWEVGASGSRSCLMASIVVSADESSVTDTRELTN
jgi:hypothetical protein